MSSNEMGNPLYENEMACEPLICPSNEGTSTCDDSSRNIYVVDQRKFHFILMELSNVLQMVAQRRDELLKRIDEESNGRSITDGKTELG